MSQKESPRRPYTRPTLSIYGDLVSITRTFSNDKNKNDALQGQNNLKT
jgi:hypothetical protein